MEELIDEKDFYIISNYIKKICAREIPYSKEYLIRQKLENLLQEKNFSSFHDFAENLTLHGISSFNDEIISAMSVNETFFFRDEHPFLALDEFILKKIFSKKDCVNIWSAACSTGQEIYSIVMTIEKFLEKFPEYSNRKYNIYATDIDKKVLEYAQKGSYSEMEIKRGLSRSDLNRYFDRKDNKYYFKDDLRQSIEFSQFDIQNIENCKDDIYDIIFLRNLLIYFDTNLKEKIVQIAGKKLQDQGFLILGAAESLFGLDVPFDSVSSCGTILYQRKNEA